MNYKGRILITDHVHPLLVPTLAEAGFYVEYCPEILPETVRRKAGEFDGLVINSKVQCDRMFLNANQQLKFVGRLGSGLDNIDLISAKELDIEVIRSPEGNAIAVAEHTIGMLLSLKNHLHKANSEVKEMKWLREENRGVELAGKTFGVIGVGNTGSALIQRLQHWGMNIVAYDKYRTDLELAFPYVKNSTLEHLIEASDIVSIHLPLDQDTRGMFDTDLLASMKEGAVLINTSRGPIVDTKALCDFLMSGHLSGACLDVLENENFNALSEEQSKIYRQLFDMNQVIISPHIAGWTQQSLEKIATILSEKILKFYEHKGTISDKVVQPMQIKYA